MFFETLLATGVGALIGTYAAQKASEKFARKREALTQANNLNLLASHMLVGFNYFVHTKKNVVLPLIKQYEADRERFQSSIASGSDFMCDIDLMDFDCRYNSTDTIESLMKEIFQSSPRLIGLLAELVTSNKELRALISKRSTFIDRKLKQNNMNKKEYLSLYFGLYDDGVNKSTEFFDIVTSLSHSLDDCLYFSKEACLEINKHQNKIEKSLYDDFWIIHKYSANIKINEHSHITPDKSNYNDWEKSFGSTIDKISTKRDSWYFRSNPSSHRE